MTVTTDTTALVTVNDDCCYHCGETLPVNTSYSALIGGVERAMCCPGCKAVAELIDSSGMANFYQRRTAFNVQPVPEHESDSTGFEAYDIPEVLETFTVDSGTGMRTASLLLGGISCAACTWLIETSLQRLAGISTCHVSLQQNKLDVSYDPQRIKPSQLIAAVAALGYTVQPFLASAQRDQLATDNRRDLRRLAVAWLAMMQVGMFSIALHAGDIQGMASEYQTLLRWVSLLVTSFVVVFCARPFFESAGRHLRQGALVMDLPVALAIGIAWLASGVATLTGGGQVYFDSIVMFTALLLLARYAERRMWRRNTLNWLDVQETLPPYVAIRDGAGWIHAARQGLTAGATVLVKAGALVPVDGKVTRGVSAVNEQTFTGEQLPRAVATGDTVFAGTVNLEGSLEIETAGNHADSRLARLQRSSELGRQGKPRLAQMADRLASKFVAAVLLLTAATALVWSFIDPSRALWVALSVLVISCPCALSLATPSALASAASYLRRAGIMVSGDNALSSLAQTTHLVLDKTGTLTQGEFSLVSVSALGTASRESILATAAGLQRHSNHPIAQAFANLEPSGEVTQPQYQVGAGVAGNIGNSQYRMGSEAFCKELQRGLPPAPNDTGYWVALVSEHQALAWIALADPLRPEAPALIADAQSRGLALALLTGDSGTQGPELARQLGITDFQTGTSPQEKMAEVARLQDTGAVVTMVGDGLNDAPVLARADTSIAMANAAELTRTHADLVVIDAGLESVTLAMDKARSCRRIIVQNFAWALSYNLCAIPLAVTGQVAPWMAAVGMSLSSLLVVANSLRLNRPLT